MSDAPPSKAPPTKPRGAVTFALLGVAVVLAAVALWLFVK